MSGRIGFIGLGNMGRGMASNLCRKGFSLTVFDINPVPMEALRQLGARAVAGTGEVANASDIVVTMLPDSAALERVAFGAACSWI